MQRILDFPVDNDQAAIWFLGQAGYVFRSCCLSIAIDPYLTDSIATVAADFARRYPPPILPECLDVDLIAITHNHQDHLDPETIEGYRHKDTTLWVAPHLTAPALVALGVPTDKVLVLDAGETATPFARLTITGVYAVPTGADAVDTCGYLFEFANGRSIYHSADTSLSPVLLEAAPHAEALLVCINGKWRNLNVHEALELTRAVAPRFAIPNHYDLMSLNSENPEAFRAFAAQVGLAESVRILSLMEPFVWSGEG